jgi:serine/threonine protein kinase
LILYEMITGKNPYHVNHIMTILSYKLLEEFLPKPSLLIPSLPDNVEKIILKGISKNVNERYTSMKTFATELEKLSINEPVHQHPPEVPYEIPVKTIFQNDNSENSTDADYKFDHAIKGIEEDIIKLINIGDRNTATQLLLSLNKLGGKEQQASERIRKRYKL